MNETPQQRYARLHPDRVSASHRAWRARNPEKVRAIKRAWNAKNRDRVNAMHRIERRVSYQRVRDDLFAILGDRCACGFADRRALQIDHVNGGGRRAGHHGNQYKLLRAVRAHPEHFQVLCANCNQIKKYESTTERGGDRYIRLTA